MKDETAYLGLGSNLGDRQKYITDAIYILKNTKGITLNAVSPIYETKPVGYVDQPDFLNCVAEITTNLSPLELLDVCMSIENELERKRIIKWGPRTVDLDILFFGNVVIETERLTLPHPFLHERGFVLLPLMDITPSLIHPKLNVSIKDLYKNIDCKDVRRFNS